MAKLFSADYATAREKFRRAARGAGLTLDELELAAAGPRGEPLTIDIAQLGARQPDRVLLHFSGLHGLEGFAGSAIQLRLLDSPPSLSATDAMVLIHAVNPFGMAWLRRVNENNVDLNRNFLAPGESFSGSPDGYAELDSVLNPQGPPRTLDFFYIHFLWKVITVGLRKLKQSVAGGQYDYPQGLFFGGQKLEQSGVLLVNWLSERFSGIQRLGILGVHTGLGPRGADALLVPHSADSGKFARLTHALGNHIAESGNPDGVAYPIRGLMAEAIARELDAVDTWMVYQEFGTLPVARVVQALRDENRYHHYATPKDLDSPFKRKAMEAFCPSDAAWREEIVRRGHQIAIDFANLVFSRDASCGSQRVAPNS
ncbi:MAG TPA: DUF2817 domain-containing protein [Thermoguttaceae bacterium]|nr:DUF2817 domain-containing protein [Thermoguttaceae bacterium]